MDIKEIKQQAQDENTSPEILIELAKSKDKEILRRVAGNPNTPVEILEILGAEFPDAIVENPIFDLLLLENPESKFILLSLAGASTTSVEKLKKLAEHQDRDIRVAVAANYRTPTDLINKILKGDWQMKESVAKHPKTSPELLYKFAKENSFYVCSAIAKRKNIPEEIITILMQSGCWSSNSLREESYDNYRHSRRDLDSWHVRDVLASNPNVSKNVIDKLREDKHHHVRAAIAKREDISEEQAMILARDTSDYVRSVLANNPNVSNTAKKLLNIFEKDWKTRVYINNTTYSKPNRKKQEELLTNAFPEQVVTKISPDNSNYIRRLLATNPNISANSIVKLKEDSEPCVILGLTHNTDMPIEILEELATNADSLVRKGVAEHSKVTVEILDKLKDERNTNIREKVAQSSKISIKIIEELARDSVPLVRRAIAANIKTPANILDKLKSDRSLTVRLAVAENPNTSIDTLQELLNDEASKIVETANNSLKRRSL